MSSYSRQVRAGGLAALVVVLSAAHSSLAQAPRPATGPISVTSPGPVGAGPTITMTITHGPNGAVIFSGTVSAAAPAGLVVTLSGGPGVSGSAIVLADGTWSITLTLPPGATGTATATVTDVGGRTGSTTAGY
jgi:hypothetical protein